MLLLLATRFLLLATFLKMNSQTRFAKFCSVCRDAGKPIDLYTNHFVKDQPGPNGKVVCPTLLAQPCRYCKETGHTVKYCPKLVNQNNQNRFKKSKVTTKVFQVDTEEELMDSPHSSPKDICNDVCISMPPTIPSSMGSTMGSSTTMTTTTTTSTNVLTTTADTFVKMPVNPLPNINTWNELVYYADPNRRNMVSYQVVKPNLPTQSTQSTQPTYADIIRKKVENKPVENKPVKNMNEIIQKKDMEIKYMKEKILKLEQTIANLRNEKEKPKNEKNNERKNERKNDEKIDENIEDNMEYIVPYNVVSKFLKIEENFSWADEMEMENIEIEDSKQVEDIEDSKQDDDEDNEADDLCDKMEKGLRIAIPDDDVVMKFRRQKAIIKMKEERSRCAW